MTGNKRPTIIITMGDPAGIGPEIAVKALSNPAIYSLCRPLIVGDFNLLQKTAKHLKLNQKFRRLDSPRNAKGELGIIDVVDLKNVDIKTLKIGTISAEAGRASLDYVEKAVAYALRGDAQAIVTAPINKKAIQEAGSRHIGHTELIAALSGVNEPLTMFWVRGARIFFLTRHLPLKEALKAVRKERLMDAIIHVDGVLRQIGVVDPRLAVAALNPHASDGGLLGEEEAREIIPAIKAVRARGVNACGPIPADSVFHLAVEGRYDAVLSLYHDQGHIAAKTLDFYGTVSVTLDLPFIRTSVDHGTAHEIAGKGIANPKSLEEAVKLASRLLSSRSPTS
ncbi:4-hydroxythreonine-4-phosphate dehydrogenase [miscellaneous Crenarchaeota group archaeon SMTZ1-55]|nr:MAG: 4-hydroxythreonine-4-phosphate dehydrogenase [miscellaneous Crenarchaeota group archaeon SMTZ1-55]